MQISVFGSVEDCKTVCEAGAGRILRDGNAAVRQQKAGRAAWMLWFLLAIPALRRVGATIVEVRNRAYQWYVCILHCYVCRTNCPVFTGTFMPTTCIWKANNADYCRKIMRPSYFNYSIFFLYHSWRISYIAIFACLFVRLSRTGS